MFLYVAWSVSFALKTFVGCLYFTVDVWTLVETVNNEDRLHLMFVANILPLIEVSILFCLGWLGHTLCKPAHSLLFRIVVAGSV